jgi:hypothetical protein
LAEVLADLLADVLAHALTDVLAVVLADVCQGVCRWADVGLFIPSSIRVPVDDTSFSLWSESYQLNVLERCLSTATGTSYK